MTQRVKQAEVLFALLERHANQWVPLPSILELGIAQYNARIYELRGLGHRIENKIEKHAGVTHSWFKLVATPRTGNLFE